MSHSEPAANAARSGAASPEASPAASWRALPFPMAHSEASRWHATQTVRPSLANPDGPDPTAIGWPAVLLWGSIRTTDDRASSATQAPPAPAYT